MRVIISKDSSGRIMVVFPYDPQLVAKVRTIEGRKWHPEKKHWSFPDSDGTLEKILKVFEGEEIHVDTASQSQLSNSSINHNPTLAEPSQFPTLAKGGKGGFSDQKISLTFPEHTFEDLRRELVSRKYSYKTVKGYLYYNRDFLKFIDKKPSEIKERRDEKTDAPCFRAQHWRLLLSTWENTSLRNGSLKAQRQEDTCR